MSSATSTASAPVWRRPQVLAIAGVLVLALAAGGWFFLLRDSDGAYCEDLQAWNDKSSETPPEAASTDAAAAGEFAANRISDRISGATDFSNDGPDDVQGDWKIYADGLQSIVDTVQETLGYDLTDPASVQQFLADVQANTVAVDDPAVQAKLQEAQAALASEKATSAVSGITDDASERCDIDLNLSTSATP